MAIAHGKIAEQFAQELEREGLTFERLPHSHVESALSEARVIDVSPDSVAKTVVVVSDRGFIRAVVPASHRLDLGKLSKLFETRRSFRLATEPELAAAYQSFEVGAVPPLGGRDDDCVALDRRLAHLDSVVIEAGTHDESVRLRTRDLVIEAAAVVGDICRDEDA